MTFHAVRFESTDRALRQWGYGSGDPLPWAFDVVADHAGLRLRSARYGTFLEIPSSAIDAVACRETVSSVLYRRVELAVTLTLSRGGATWDLPLVPLTPDRRRTLRWNDVAVKDLAAKLSGALGIGE